MPRPDHWHVVATTNDPPETLPEPLRSRLVCTIHLTAPAPGLVESLTTPEARRLVCARSREYDVRSLIAYDQLRSEGWSREAAAAVVFDATTAESLLDAVKLEAAKPRGK